MITFSLFFTAMLSDNNSVKLKSDYSPPVQWCKVAAHEDEKTKLVFKRYSQVSVIVTATQRTVFLPPAWAITERMQKSRNGLTTGYEWRVEHTAFHGTLKTLCGAQANLLYYLFSQAKVRS